MILCEIVCDACKLRSSWFLNALSWKEGREAVGEIEFPPHRLGEHREKLRAMGWGIESTENMRYAARDLCPECRKKGR